MARCVILSVRQPSPKKSPLVMERDNRLLAPLGDDTDLDLAFLDVKDGIRWVPYRGGHSARAPAPTAPSCPSGLAAVRADAIFDARIIGDGVRSRGASLKAIKS
jgi:hypothetical protein